MKYIDCHVHITPDNMLRASSLELYHRWRRDREELKKVVADPSHFIRILDNADVEKACLITIVSPDIEGMPFEYNDFIANYSNQYPDRLLAIGSIHPGHSKDVKADFEHIIDELGMKGIKLHPPHQCVYPNEYRTAGNKALSKIYELAQERRIPVIIHTGTSIFPDARNIYADPIYVDDVSVDFPDLKIVLAHGGRPLWMQTAVFLIRRHENVYMDISGIPPRRLLEYFPRLEEFSSKTMFGSDWAGPMIPGIRENIEEFLQLPISSRAKDEILRGTALRVF